MVIFLYNAPSARYTNGDSMQAELFANFETEQSIAGLLDHARRYLPGIVGLNINEAGWLDQLSGDRVFNYTYGFGLLSESVQPTFALEARQVDYVGAQPSGLYISANKPHCSSLMASRGFLCPQTHIVCPPLSKAEAEQVSSSFAACDHLVLKPAYEESSVGLMLIPNSPDEICTAALNLHDRLPGVQILQEYIPGVDVTVPIVGRRQPHCLPAVVLTHEMPTSDPFVFDATLKATKSCVHYEPTNTWPHHLQAELYRMAEAAYQLTEQRDYSRVDCRVTPDGQCYFLEINANPQLGLDKASYAVSARAAGLELGYVLRAIVNDDTAELSRSMAVAGPAAAATKR